LKLALLGLVLPGAVLGMLNMAPASLHLELHSDTSRMELREQTGARRLAGRQEAAAAVAAVAVAFLAARLLCAAAPLR
jgi:hypothetical protein